MHFYRNRRCVPSQDIVALSWRRWAVETHYRDEKTLQHIEQFPSRTPNSIRQELFAMLISCVIARTLTALSVPSEAHETTQSIVHPQLKNALMSFAREAALLTPAHPAQALCIFQELLHAIRSGCPLYTNTHQFDVHGTTKYCWQPPIVYPFHLYCGQAGEFTDIRFNMIRYTTGTGVKVRGLPTMGAEVVHNVFAESQVWGGWLDDAALVQTQGDNLEQWDNQFGLDTLGEAGRCDPPPGASPT